MSVPFLHDELLDSIVDLLRDDTSLLRSCSLLSKSWLPRTRRHLFVEVRLPTAHDLQSWKTTFPDPFTSPAYYARLLSIGCPQEIVVADAEEGSWLRAFSRIRKLEVDDHSDINADDDSDIMSTDNDDSGIESTNDCVEIKSTPIVSLVPLYGLSTVLTSIRIRASTVAPSEIPNIIYSFPHLKDIALFLYGGSAGYNDDHQQPTTVRFRPSPPFSGSLRLYARKGIYAIAGRLFSLRSDPHFRDLLLALSEERDFPAAAALVDSCSSTLECLQLDHFPHRM